MVRDEAGGVTTSLFTAPPFSLDRTCISVEGLQGKTSKPYIHKPYTCRGDTGYTEMHIGWKEKKGKIQDCIIEQLVLYERGREPFSTRLQPVNTMKVS